MRWLTLAICGLALALGQAQASPLAITQITVTAAPDIAAAGGTLGVTGNATVDNSGPLPLVSIPQTALLLDPGGNLLIEHTGSGLSLTLAGLADPVLVNDFVINLGANGLIASVIAPGLPTAPILVSDILTNGDLALSAAAAGLFVALGFGDLTGFVWGSVSFAEAPVPAPAALTLLLAGLAGLATLRRRTA
jgi:hypothetical protein